jgi:hypothetical protein
MLQGGRLSRGFALKLLRKLWDIYGEPGTTWLDQGVIAPSEHDMRVLFSACADSQQVFSLASILHFISAVGLAGDCFWSAELPHHEALRCGWCSDGRNASEEPD